MEYIVRGEQKYKATIYNLHVLFVLYYYNATYYGNKSYVSVELSYLVTPLKLLLTTLLLTVTDIFYAL